MDRVSCVVIGAGVIGLATARELARHGLETILLERENAFCTISSARNSEVIHAGIYYPQDSLKATLCVQGNRMLYEYAKSHHIPFNRCGKLIVSSSTNQDGQLQEILNKAMCNGVPGMSTLDAKQAKALEPQLNVTSALLSETTGVIDSHSYMLSLLGEFEDAGGMIAYQSPLKRATLLNNGEGGFRLEVGGQEPFELETRYLINCAGLSAPAIAQKIEGLDTKYIPKAYFAKGNYFVLGGKSPFSRLIYPVPEPGGLGVHLTLDMGGQGKFGPDVQWLDITSEEEIDYTVDPTRGEKFYSAVRQYWPGLQDGMLHADYSGVRAKISAPNQEAADFRIDDATVHGLEGLINLFGFESPGLTSSLAIAQEVKRRLNRV